VQKAAFFQSRAALHRFHVTERIVDMEANKIDALKFKSNKSWASKKKVSKKQAAVNTITQKLALFLKNQVEQRMYVASFDEVFMRNPLKKSSKLEKVLNLSAPVCA